MQPNMLPQPYYRGPPAPQGQSQIFCAGCSTLLMYPQGAANVRCARCHHITPVAPVHAGNEMAQVCCRNQGCGIMLMYPRGANQVQCSMCGTITCAMQSNQVGHVVCGGCSVTLMYQYGAQSVKCAVCNHVTGVQQMPGGSGSQGPVPQQQQQQPGGMLPSMYNPHMQQQAPQQQQQMPHQVQNGGGGEAQQQAEQQQPRVEVQHVVIENPPTLDDKGHEVQSIAVGVTTKPDAK